jgi:hypothetical protein
MKPGLEPDINSVLIAAASAWIAVKVMPAIWQMVEGLSEEVGASSPILKSH